MVPLRSPHRFAIVAALALVSSASGVARPAQNTGAIVLSYAAPSSVVLHQPIVVQFMVQNGTSESVRLNLGLGATRNFVVRIVRPDGVVVDAPSVPPLKEGPLDPGRRAVAALGTYTQDLILNDWAAFDQSGSYTIDIDLAAKIQSQTGETIAALTRGMMTVRVGPRDDGVLNTICHELFWEIRNTTDTARRYAAARKLAQVKDEVALPYITQIIDDTDAVDHFLIPGLVRLGTPGARSILAEMAQSSHDGRAAQASDALHGLGKRRH